MCTPLCPAPWPPSLQVCAPPLFTVDFFISYVTRPGGGSNLLSNIVNLVGSFSLLDIALNVRGGAVLGVLGVWVGPARMNVIACSAISHIMGSHGMGSAIHHECS